MYRENYRLPAEWVTRAIGRWILETAELKGYGMPEGSFQLFLDGNPLPEKMAEIFNVVQRNVAFQVALDMCYDQGRLTRPQWLERRLRSGYHWEDLPHVLEDIQAGPFLLHPL